jgi:sugar phosphate isomerase/epimerase
VAAEFLRYGLDGVQLTPNFPGLGFHEPGQITPERCRRVAEPFHAAGLPIAALWGSTNLLDPNLSRRHRGILRLHALLRHAPDFGTPYVITESGSLNPHSPWEPYAPNRSAGAWAELRLIVAEALRVAADRGVTLLLKVARTHVLASVEDALRLRDDLDAANLGLVLDPAAFLLDTPLEQLPAALDRLVEQLGPRAPIVHAKDLRHDEQGVSLPRVGAGVLDYGRLLARLDRHQPQAPVILEHLCPEEVPVAVAAMRRFLALSRESAPA